eukprot:gene2893-392_t
MTMDMHATATASVVSFRDGRHADAELTISIRLNSMHGHCSCQ